MMIYRLLIIPAMLFFSFQTYGQSDGKSNADLLQEVLAAGIEPAYAHIPDGAYVSFDIRFPEYDWFIHHRLTELFRERGYAVTGNDDTNGSRYVIEAGVERFGIRYTDVYRQSVFGRRMLGRVAEAVISFRIEGAGDHIVFRSDKELRDDIPYALREEVESPVLPFTQAALPAGSTVDRYLGPAIIIAATGAVVYLFFSVRS